MIEKQKRGPKEKKLLKQATKTTKKKDSVLILDGERLDFVFLRKLLDAIKTINCVNILK